MISGRDKKLIELFLNAFNGWHGGQFRIESEPDVVIRHRKAVDAIAVDGIIGLAIEHTLLQPFADAKRDAVPFLEVAGRLDRRVDLLEPGWSVMLLFEVGGVPTGVDWTAASISLEGWFTRTRATFPQGLSEHIVEECGFPLKVIVDRGLVPGSPGSLFIGRVPPPGPIDPMVRKALEAKVPKLSETAVDLRVLLLELDSPARGCPEIGTAIESARVEQAGLADITEVWVARTTAWLSEDFVSWHLVWPLAEAIKFQRGIKPRGLTRRAAGAGA